MNFREINHWTLLTIRGRKRVTALLLAILVLLSVFVSATIITFGTIEATEAAERARQYGKWQVMYYAAKQEELDRLSAAGDHFATAEFLSDESDIGIVAAAEDQWLDYAAVELAEGRFAQNAGEIALVRSQDTEGYSVGDRITVKHSFYHVRNAGSTGGESSLESAYDIFLPYIQIPEDLSKYEKSWNESREFYAGWGSDYDHDFAELDDTARRTVAIYEYINDVDQYKGKVVQALYGSTRFDNKLLSHNGKRVVLNYTTGQTVLNGEWFGDNRGMVFEDEPAYNNIEVYAEYTVCGIVEPYSEAWDRDMFDMPSAFVSPADAEDMRAAIEYVTAEEQDLPARERQMIALGYSSDMAADRLYDRLGGIYAETHSDTYGMHFGSMDGYITGYLYGTDARTGETRYVSLIGQGTYTNVTLSAAQLMRNFSMDDLRSGKVQIDGLEPPKLDVTAAGAYLNQSGRDFRLNTYTYQSGGSSYQTLQNFLLGSIFFITFCTLLVAFMAQMKYRMRREKIFFALGMTRGDMTKLNAVEGLYYTLLPLPVGFGLGLLASIGLVRATAGEGAKLTVNWLPLVLAMVGCGAVVLLSMTLMSAVGRRIERRKSKVRSWGKANSDSRATIGIAVSRFTGRQIMAGVTAVLGVVACAVFALLLLIGGAKMEYKETVELPAKPDYVLSSPFGMTEPFAADTAEKLADIPGIGEARAFMVAEGVYIACDEELMNGAIVADRYEKLGGTSKFGMFGEDVGYRTDLYAFVSGIPEEVREVIEQAAGSDIDWESVESGQSCIAIVPRYIDGDGDFRMSTGARDAYFGEVDGSWKAGETLRLYANSVRQVGGEMQRSVTQTEMEVEAVVHDFSGEGVYPFSAAEDIVLIGGAKTIKQLYPSSGVRVKSPEEASGMVTRAVTYYGTSMGTTSFYCTADDAFTIDTERGMNSAAGDMGATLLAYHGENADLRSRTEMSVLMFGMLAAAIVLMMLIIYWYVVGSIVESRNRELGILKALGASDGGIVGAYFAMAARLHLLALVIGNGVFFGAVVLIEYLRFGDGREFFEYVGRFNFGEYPWAIHIAVCGVILAVGSLFYAISARKVCRQPVAENIRTKE